MSASNTASGSAGVVSVRSVHAFADTVSRVMSTLANHGIKVFAVIDQAAEAKAAGLALPPTTLIVFGNPKAGTPLMVAQPLCGLDLPLKALVTELTSGEVTVSFNAAGYIAERHSLPQALAGNLAPAEQLITNAVAR